MVDFVKLRVDDQDMITFYHSEYEPSNEFQKNGFLSYEVSLGIQFDFQIVNYQKGNNDEFSYLYISFKPHYIFNDGLHNGNDFSAFDCQQILGKVFDYLEMNRFYIEDFLIVNLEFGVNLIPLYSSKDIVDNTIFYKRSRFIINKGQYSKISSSNRNDLTNSNQKNVSSYKAIKFYCKGIHLEDKGLSLKDIKVDRNTLRFEIKTKRSSAIRQLFNTSDKPTFDLLFSNDFYFKAKSILFKEYRYVFILRLNEEPLKSNEINYWNNLFSNTEVDSKKLQREKEKYKKSGTGIDLHSHLFGLIISKLNRLTIMP